MPSRGKILVIRGGAIGDFILTLPVLAALRRQFPDTWIECLGYSHIAQIALAGGLVENVRSIEARALAGFFARDGDLDPALSDYFSAFDLVISYLFDPDEIFQTNIRRCSLAQFIAAPHRPNDRGQTHATEVFLKPLERIAIFDADPVPRLNLNSREILLPDPLARAIALHPGSGSERKNWPEWRWSDLLQRLVETTSLKLVLVGGEAEGNRLEKLADALPADRREVAKNLPLVDLAHRLQHCAAFVGHDSGISHLAAAVGLPGVILWGETAEDVWRPRTDKFRIVRDPGGLSRLPVEQVFAEIEAVFEG